MSYKLHVYENGTELARSVADFILEQVLLKKNENKFLNLALSGGSTPKQLFTVLVNEYKNLIPWESLRLFWVDERCVDPNDPQSNYGVAYDILLSKVSLPGDNIFRMKGEEVPVDEALRYQQLLKQELPAINDYPVFDLILLGMGDDGHTASIFPTQMELLECENAVDVGIHPQSGQKRITLTGETINNAKRLIFMITGVEKSEVFQTIFDRDPDCEQYPAAHVFDLEGDVDFYVDTTVISRMYL